MSENAEFSISTPSRHPANQKGYDPTKHSYRSDYVNPKFWELILHVFFPGMGESYDGKPIIPANVTSIQWIVKKGAFEKKINRSRSSSMIGTKVKVPEQGEYEITLQVNLTNNTKQSSTRNYNLRDLLIVGVGDSFASGQGNPDVPAIPSPDQKVVCAATSVALAYRKSKDFIIKFGKELHEKTKEKIEKYLPFAGKIVVAEINELEDKIGFVKNSIDNLTNWTIELGRKFVAVVSEGIEEFFSKVFHIGDGADFDENDPRPAAWQEPNAYRSYRSGQSLAAGQAETNTAFGANRITFLSFGRTGSEIDDGLLGPRTIAEILSDDDTSIDGWIKNVGQIEEARTTVGNRRIDALIITIGVNDLSFSTLVTDSILMASGEKRKKRIRDARNKINNQFPVQLDLLKQAIDTQLNPRKVFITEYPISIFKEVAEGAKPCDVLGSTLLNPATLEGLNLDKFDAIGLGELGRNLNDKIREKANEFGWILIDGIESGFDGHGYCASRSFFVSAKESCLNQNDFEGMLHPNKLGHELTRDCIALALRKELLSPQREKWLEPVLHMMMR